MRRGEGEGGRKGGRGGRERECIEGRDGKVGRERMCWRN